MRKRNGFTLLAVFLLLSALAVALYCRWIAPPETARLLPDSDAIVCVNLKPLRAATHFDRNPVIPSPSYQHFIDATGIVLERDLDSAALGLHRMGDPGGPNGPVAFSEVFAGRFDSGRLKLYLEGISSAKEKYADHTIFVVPSEVRAVRVAVLGDDLVAVSNAPTASQIHAILDRRSTAGFFAGSPLLDARYKEVPAFSTAWAIGEIGLPFAENGKITLMGLELPLAPDTPFVASLGVSPLHPGAVALRVDEIAGDEAAAARSAEVLSGLLGLFRSIQMAQQASELRAVTDTIRITQNKDRATLTATIPVEALKQLVKQ